MALPLTTVSSDGSRTLGRDRRRSRRAERPSRNGNGCARLNTAVRTANAVLLPGHRLEEKRNELAERGQRDRIVGHDDLSVSKLYRYSRTTSVGHYFLIKSIRS